MLVGHDDDKDVLCGLMKVLGHLFGGRHRLRRQRLHRLAFHDLRQRGEGHGQHDDQGDPGGDDEPGRAHDDATQQGETIEALRGPVVVAFFNTVNSSRLFTNYFARQRDYFALQIVRAFRLFDETEVTAPLAPVSRL